MEELQAMYDKIQSKEFKAAIKLGDKYLASIEEPGLDEEAGNLGYYFADVEEYLLYMEISKEWLKERQIKEVVILNGLASQVLQMQAYAYHEMGDFESALEVLDIAIAEYNPIGTSIRFEMVENLIKLEIFDEAEQQLKTLRSLIMSEENMARLYRRYGYIKIEQNKLTSAKACYQYSLFFDKNKNAVSEIAYIDEIKGKIWDDGNMEKNLDLLFSDENINECMETMHRKKLAFYPQREQAVALTQLITLYKEHNDKERVEKYERVMRLWMFLMDTADKFDGVPKNE